MILKTKYFMKHDFEEKIFSKKDDFEENFFSKSMILNEKVFVKSMILNIKIFVLSDFETTFYNASDLELKISRRVRF